MGHHSIQQHITPLYEPGWWLAYPSEKYEFVSWDDEIPFIWKVIIQPCSSHHQPAIIWLLMVIICYNYCIMIPYNDPIYGYNYPI